MQITVSRTSTCDAAIRLTGTISSAEGSREVWFDIPGDLEDDVSASGDAWLVLMLPLAMQGGEAIELSRPVDPLLLENARQLVATWGAWYPDLRPCAIQAPCQRAAVSAGRVAQFFSGGVDAWFTLLRHFRSTPRFPQVGDVDDLITVSGLDIPIDNTSEFAQLEGATGAVAARYGKRHVVVRTNLRDRMDGAWKAAWGPRWGSLSHGAALAAIGLLLQRRYSRIVIGSTGLGTLVPWGSHPMTDVLFSTSATAFQHDHAAYTRADKLERIAESPDAVSELKVCFAGGTFRNCSVCSKCHRTLLSLDVLGALHEARSFDVKTYLGNRNREMLAWTDNDRALLRGVRDLAVRRGRSEIVAVIDRSLARSARVKAVIEGIRRVSWRGWQAAYRKLAGDMIGA